MVGWGGRGLAGAGGAGELGWKKAGPLRRGEEGDESLNRFLDRETSLPPSGLLLLTQSIFAVKSSTSFHFFVM